MTTMQTEPTLADQAARLRQQLSDRQGAVDVLEQRQADLQVEWTETLSAGGDTTSVAAQRADVERLLADERAAVEQLGGWLDEVAAKQRKAAGFTTLLTDLEAYTQRVEALSARPTARQLVRDAITRMAELAGELRTELQALEAEHGELTQQWRALGYRAEDIGYGEPMAPVPDVLPVWVPSNEMEAAQIWHAAQRSARQAAEALGTVVGRLLDYPENLAALLELIAPDRSR